MSVPYMFSIARVFAEAHIYIYIYACIVILYMYDIIHPTTNMEQNWVNGRDKQKNFWYQVNIWTSPLDMEMPNEKMVDEASKNGEATNEKEEFTRTGRVDHWHDLRNGWSRNIWLVVT